MLIAFAVPGFAQRGPREGKKYDRGWRCPSWYGGEELTDEQSAALRELHQSFIDETVDLRTTVWTKKGELNILLDSSNPDEQKVMNLVKELNEAKSLLKMKKVEYLLKARKIAPGFRGYGFGPGRHGWGGPMMDWDRGRGYGRHMKDWDGPMMDWDRGRGYGRHMRDWDGPHDGSG